MSCFMCLSVFSLSAVTFIWRILLVRSALSIQHLRIKWRRSSEIFCKSEHRNVELWKTAEFMDANTRFDCNWGKVLLLLRSEQEVHMHRFNSYKYVNECLHLFCVFLIFEWLWIPSCWALVPGENSINNARWHNFSRLFRTQIIIIGLFMS